MDILRLLCKSRNLDQHAKVFFDTILAIVLHNLEVKSPRGLITERIL